MHAHSTALLPAWQVCPLTVPKYHMFKKATAEQHYDQMGYYKVTDPKTGKEGYELPDRYLQRVGGFVTFYAALMQSELWPLRSPNGISSVWQYMARSECCSCLRKNVWLGH